MSKSDIVRVDESKFWDWINERHRIFLKKQAGEPKPWTDDSAMREYKFTNVFRELDRGTVALRMMEKPFSSDLRNAKFLIWNTIWYRMFNRYEHATDVGWNEHYEDLVDRFQEMDAAGHLIFTSAHMTVGRQGQRKMDTMLQSLGEIWKDLDMLTKRITGDGTLESAFLLLKQYMGIGPFISYEMVSDMRHHVLAGASDIMTWANIGPGCERGLRRIGKWYVLSSLVALLEKAPDCVGDHLIDHVRHQAYPHFELREIEHSLCEFDKWQRVLTGAGRPRQRYNGNY